MMMVVGHIELSCRYPFTVLQYRNISWLNGEGSFWELISVTRGYQLLNEFLSWFVMGNFPGNLKLMKRTRRHRIVPLFHMSSLTHPHSYDDCFMG